MYVIYNYSIISTIMLAIFYPLTDWDVSPSTVVPATGNAAIGSPFVVQNLEANRDNSARCVYSAFKTY